MANKTIKELADELGVSKQAIRKHLDRLPPTLVPIKIKGVYTLNVDIQDFIRDRVSTVTTNVGGNEEPEVDTKIDTLYASIIQDLKQDKVDLKDQVDQLQKLLDQQQQLTLQANQQIEQLQHQVYQLQPPGGTDPSEHIDGEKDAPIHHRLKPSFWENFWGRRNK
jgi:Predicted transcriptional regulator